MSENKEEKRLADGMQELPTQQGEENDSTSAEGLFDAEGEEDVKPYTPGKGADSAPTSEKTMLFGKIKETEEDKSASGESLSNTRYFNLRGKGKRSASDKNKRNLMHSFRVLSKNSEDRAILEAPPAGRGGRGLADSVKPQQGEDVFQAVEKAYTDKQREKKQKEEKLSVKKQHRERGLAKARELQAALKKEAKGQKRLMLIYGVLLLVSLVLTLFFSRTAFYPVAALLLSAVTCVLSLPAFRKSLRSIARFRPSGDTALVIMCIFVLIHNLCVLLLAQQASVYTCCMIFVCLVRVLVNYLRLRSRIRLVEGAFVSKSPSTLQRIPVKNDAGSFAKRLGKGAGPDIFYCAEAMLDISLDEPESDGTAESKYYVFTMSFVLLASLVVGLFCFTTEMTGLGFVTALTATVCALLPVMYDPVSRYTFYRKGGQLQQQGVFISGREALSGIGESDGFVLDASDVFSGEVSRFRKSAASDMDQNDSAVFAALLIREAGSVLSPCFDEFLEQMNIIIPPVENFLYEERLGYSAWVLDRKVLVGNRQMLLNHSVSVPTREQERAYAKGRYVMYVVIDGEITATFLVDYRVRRSLRKYSRDFNKTGLVLMLDSREAFLDEQAAAMKLSVDASSVKVLSSKAAAIMEKYNSRYDKQLPTGLLCRDKKQGIMHLIMSCYNANARDRLILIMMLLGQLLGFVVLVLSAVLNMKLFFNPAAIVVIRLLWSLVTAFVVERKNK